MYADVPDGPDGTAPLAWRWNMQLTVSVPTAMGVGLEDALRVVTRLPATTSPTTVAAAAPLPPLLWTRTRPRALCTVSVCLAHSALLPLGVRAGRGVAGQLGVATSEERDAVPILGRQRCLYRCAWRALAPRARAARRRTGCLRDPILRASGGRRQRRCSRRHGHRHDRCWQRPPLPVHVPPLLAESQEVVEPAERAERQRRLGRVPRLGILRSW